MTQPHITVITPAGDDPHLLEQTLCSVLDQGYRRLQYIVVNTRRDPEITSVVELYRQGGLYEHLPVAAKAGASVAAAINLALSRAAGNVVAVLPVGDLYLPGALEAVARRFEDEHCSWLIGQAVRITPEQRMLGPLAAGAPANLLAYLCHDAPPVPLASSFWRRELLERVGTFDPELRFAFDYEFFARLLATEHRPAVLGQALAAVREPEVELSAQETVERGMELIHAAERHSDYLPLPQRYVLWLNCDRRQRIYALAHAETVGRLAQRFLWSQVLRHPWWIGDNHLRQAMRRRERAA